MTSAKLILIRGPSGAGKSTIARAVVDASSRPTALVERDHYMLMFNEAGRFSIDQKVIELVILTCLERDVDVVFEGNFKADTHRDLIGRLFAAHPEQNYIFYVDVGLEESLRRHASRPQIISEEKMRELHPLATPLGDPREVLIPEETPVDAAVRLVLDISGLQTAPS
ncbi:MAG: AAA family ATPase [Microthrixaceae bacterium]